MTRTYGNPNYPDLGSSDLFLSYEKKKNVFWEFLENAKIIRKKCDKHFKGAL